MNDDLAFFLVLMGGIAVILWVVALLDWFARRKERQSEHRAR